jgi:hypothetical protein
MDNLKLQIQNTNLISPNDRNFLLSIVDTLVPIERVKLEQAFLQSQVAVILQFLNQFRARQISNNQNQASPQQMNNNPNLFQKAVNFFKPQPEVNLPVHQSLLIDENYLGMPPVKAKIVQNQINLDSLSNLQDLSQLQLLTPEHIYFNLNQNFEQEINSFLNILDKSFEKIEDISQRRVYLMNYIQSKLFNSYISTGLTAMKHPELQPSKIILNLLHQINPVFLNNSQFRHATIITNHIRGLCGI